MFNHLGFRNQSDVISKVPSSLKVKCRIESLNRLENKVQKHCVLGMCMTYRFPKETLTCVMIEFSPLKLGILDFAEIFQLFFAGCRKYLIKPAFPFVLKKRIIVLIF